MVFETGAHVHRDGALIAAGWIGDIATAAAN